MWWTASSSLSCFLSAPLLCFTLSPTLLYYVVIRSLTFDPGLVAFGRSRASPPGSEVTSNLWPRFLPLQLWCWSPPSSPVSLSLPATRRRSSYFYPSLLNWWDWCLNLSHIQSHTLLNWLSDWSVISLSLTLSSVSVKAFGDLLNSCNRCSYVCHLLDINCYCQ